MSLSAGFEGGFGSLFECFAELGVGTDGSSHGDQVELQEVRDLIGHDDAFLRFDGMLNAHLRGLDDQSAVRPWWHRHAPTLNGRQSPSRCLSKHCLAETS